MRKAKKSIEKIELDLEKVGNLIDQAKGIAKEYRKLTGRPLGITGEVAEYEAARLLKLSLCEARKSGYDAIRSDGKKFQIKGRVIYDQSKPAQRFGSIHVDCEWDAVLLVLLEADFSPVEIHEAQRPDVEKALMEPGSRSKNVRGTLSIAKFKSIARLVWSRDAKSTAS